MLVAERDLERAVAMLVGIEKTVVEGAGAAGLAAMLADPERFAGRKVGTVLCGGNIDTHLLANVLVRDLVRSGRIARLRVAAQDRPGALAAITAKFDEAGVNIIEINHSRIFTRLPAKDTVIEVECEARDPQAIDEVVAMLEVGRLPRRARVAGLSRTPLRARSSGKLGPLCGTIRRRLTLFPPRKALFKRVYQPHKGFSNQFERSRGERTISLSQVLRDEPVAVPVSSGQGRAEGVHRTERPPRERAQRSARPDRLPPQPVGRLPPELHRLLGLRLGARARRRVRRQRDPAQADAPPRRPRGHRVQAVDDRGAI